MVCYFVPRFIWGLDATGNSSIDELYDGLGLARVQNGRVDGIGKEKYF